MTRVLLKNAMLVTDPSNGDTEPILSAPIEVVITCDDAEILPENPLVRVSQFEPDRNQGTCNHVEDIRLEVWRLKIPAFGFKMASHSPCAMAEQYVAEYNGYVYPLDDVRKSTFDPDAGADFTLTLHGMDKETGELPYFKLEPITLEQLMASAVETDRVYAS